MKINFMLNLQNLLFLFKKCRFYFVLICLHSLLLIFVVLILFVVGIGFYHTLIYVIARALQFLFFVLLPVLTLGCSLGVVLLRHPVHSLLCLISVFLMVVSLYLIAGSEFLALVFLIVYVGAVAILFLFVIMLLNIKELFIKRTIHLTQLQTLIRVAAFPIGAHFSLFFVSQFAGAASFLLQQTSYRYSGDAVVYAVKYSFRDIFLFADLLYTTYSCLFLITAFLLLTAMLGAIVLATNATQES